MRCLSGNSKGLAALVLLVLSAACSRTELPRPDSPRYASFLAAFYTGLAGLQTGEDTRAKEKLTLATQLVPGEPAAWADLALFTARQQDFEGAARYAEKAASLGPDNSAIEALRGAVESRRGKLSDAITHFRKAVTLDSRNVKARESLAVEIERQSTGTSDGEAQAELEKILATLRGNIAVQLDVARLAAKRGDTATLKRTIAELNGESKDWPAEARDRLATFAQTSQPAQAVFLRNVLLRVPAYRQSLDAVRTPSAFISEPFVRLIRLPTPASKPAAPDLAIKFAVVTGGAAQRAGTVALDDSGQMHIFEADANAVQIRGGARLAFAGPGAPGAHSVLAADLNYDFKADMVLANAAGLKIYLQQTPSQFDDVTARTKIPGNILRGNYTGAWAFDFDLDGDLDIVLGTAAGQPIVLRNNGDNTFAVSYPFSGVNGLVAFASADFDQDGTSDAAMVDGAGGLHVLMNRRFGVYEERSVPAEWKDKTTAIASADLNGDGIPDLAVLRDDGSLIRLSLGDGNRQWTADPIASATGAPNLVLGDFDNNGSIDILAGDGHLLLSDDKSFSEIKLPGGLTIDSAADLNSDGRLNPVGIDSAGHTVQLMNRGSKNYNWQTIRVRAAKGTGDQRINSFGIGGEVEIRSGLLTQKQTINSPLLHFGLGEGKETEVARIVWPNGSVQAEFGLKPNAAILAEQRLKGSCPMLFAWDGHRMGFVKDGSPWSPALGLHINAQAVAAIQQTEEWFKVPGEKLVARGGIYDLRVTAELWETFYIDRYSLKVVDHPAGTEIFTDERFAVDAPPLKIFVLDEPRPFAKATGDRGEDAGEIVQKVDAKYLDDFGRGRYQGVTRDHWVELELPVNAPAKGSLYLLGTGWMHPTDATINIALSQNSDPPPQGLSIEVPDAAGHWVKKKSGLGFLAGKGKTMVIDIRDIFVPGAPRKLRLRTNLEIYWDQLAWAAEAASLPASTVKTTPLKNAALLYRGFSAMRAANESSPETPDYDRLAGTSQKWRDLEGYYTRHGDVRELIDARDDRIVIMNAGDELRFQFAAPPPPPPGWKRDFIMAGDGWIKDGDYNCVFSNTVLPLPWHAMKNYDTPASTLEREPAYLLHRDDWQNYHTRYVTPQWFRRALWN